MRAEASRRPTGAFSRGWIGPMKNGVAEPFLIKGASGTKSLFHNGKESYQRHTDSFASFAPHLQQGGAGAVPFAVYVHECA